MQSGQNFALSMALLAGSTLVHGEAMRPALRTVHEIHAMNNTDAKHGYPVKLEGVVTYSDPDWGLLFMEDDTGAIYVNVHGTSKAFPPGARISVDAATGAGDIAPNVVNAKIRVLGGGTLPRAPQISLAELDRGAGDSRYISTEGVLRPGDQTWNRICFRIFDDGVWAIVVVPKQDSEAARALVGAKVRLKGVVGARLDATGKRLGAQLFVSSLTDIEVKVPDLLASVNSLPLPIAKLTDSDAMGRFVPRVLVRGTVIWERPGLLFADDGSGTVAIKTNKNVHVSPGVAIKVLGFPTRAEPGFILSDVDVQTAPGPPSTVLDPVIKSTAADVLNKALNRKRVRLSAKLIEQTTTPNETMFLLEEEGQRFRAILPCSASSEGMVRLRPNANLDITGLALIRAATPGRPESLLLFIGSPADILIQNNGWLTLKAVVSVSTGIGLLTIGTFVWITQLRRTVHGQTTIIRARLERELKLETQYKRLFERNLAAVFRWLPDGTIVDCNEAFANILGFASSADLIGQSYWERQVDLTARQELRAALAGPGLSNRDANLFRADGAKVCLLENITTVETAEGTLYETTAIDVTQLRQNQADLQRAKDTAEYQALNDALTGLPNRRLLSARAAHMLATARRESHDVALLYIDLDGFKLVNDSLGHAAGDMLLIQVAARLQSRVRESDTLARLGGDEFIVVLAGLHSKHESTLVADDLLRVLSEPFSLEEHEVLIGASIGISLFPEHAEQFPQLLQHADSAMYAAKRDGKNRVLYFNPELGASLRERLNLEHQLRGAIARGEITIHYQPEFDAESGDLVRFEALARWTHPTLGAISPSKFIPIAEESGLIVVLGAYILERACSEAVTWQAASSQPIQLAVNISNIQFRRENLAEEVIAILQRTGFPPQLLQLELTESVMMSGDSRASETMSRLQNFGIGFAIDDFGTGYSCLSSLQFSAFDSLKIDRSFITQLGAKPETEAMVHSIVSLAHNLGMRVIVEGIESPEQLDVVKRLGGDEVQGFLTGRPTVDPLAIIAAQPQQELAMRG
jgi:diguanylate cyclase (GGDEF)-like protein/PAS domain S-box-containing protein